MNESHYEDNPITPFAITDYRERREIFGIRRRDRRGHMYIVGKTGTGKSTLLENMVYTDIRRGEGLALIDPHGDLAEHVLDFVPEKRMEEVIYFNPADVEYPIAFNPLENVRPDLRSLVSSGLISVFKKIWPEFWGPRLEHILRHALLTLLEHPGSTLLDVPTLLTDKGFRLRILQKVTDRKVREFWFSEFDKYSPNLRSEAISPVLNKLSQFATSLPLRNIVGQSRNTFKLRKVMDEGKILIVNLSKGRIGEDNCSLLGAMLATRIMQAATTRTNIPEKDRRPFYFYVDEVHNFLTLAFADMLSESRKYGLNLILAHQYIEQLDEKMRSAIFGNVGTMISFRVGVEDAKFLAREFHPVFDESDLIGLPNYHTYLKLMIDGVTSRPFSAKTLPPLAVEESRKAEIIEFSRAKYGVDRGSIAS
ncbi:MAG: type IV secretion system DNA-binding domain-containing protein [Armatimonadetes bacterium]|nr:type IV secretion system DNA-binding domain-containing protein [Armatimonadota bacterium]